MDATKHDGRMPCAVAGTNLGGTRHRDRAKRGGIFVEVFNIFPFIPKHRPRSARPRNAANASSRPGDSWVWQTEASHHPATDDSRSMSTPTKLSPYKMRPPMRTWVTHARGWVLLPLPHESPKTAWLPVGRLCWDDYICSVHLRHLIEQFWTRARRKG